MKRKKSESLTKEQTQSTMAFLHGKVKNRALAEFLGVSEFTVSSWKTGKSTAPLSLKELAEKEYKYSSP